DMVWLRHGGVALLTVALFAWIIAYGGQEVFQVTTDFPSGRWLYGTLLSAAVALMLYDNGKGLPRYAREGNLTDMGAYLNAVLTPASEVGIVAGNINPATVPPFRLLQHRLRVIPTLPEGWQSISPPDYVVTSDPILPSALEQT